MMVRFLPLLLLLGHTLLLEAKPHSGSYAAPDVDELRLDIDDLKQAVHTTQVDLALLEERNKKQGNRDTQDLSALASQLLSLDKKVSSLEKTLDKVTADLRTLNTALSHTTENLQQFHTRLSLHDDRLSEISQLKGTLTSIAKAVGEKSVSPAASLTYQVKAGDSLERIAKAHHTTAASIRKINHLNSDKIIVGQELRIPHDPNNGQFEMVK